MNFKKILSVLAILAVMAGVAYAATDADVYDTPGPGGGEALPVCITFSGTAGATPSDLVVTIPDGFTPAYVEFHQDYDAAAGSAAMTWHKGMSQDTGFSISAAGDPAYASSNGVSYSTTANTLTIAAEMQSASGSYVGRACR